jgi:tetratricopeptide (TPR) repeat protein
MKVRSPDGREVEAQQVDFKPVKVNWNEYKLEDGTVLKFKSVIGKVYRAEEHDPMTGDPFYLVSSSGTVHVNVPDKLKRQSVSSRQSKTDILKTMSYPPSRLGKESRMISVFISSTFRDMHAERDYLVKVVFPELRERCARRQLHLMDVDLRWGVTEEEAERGKVLEIILDEIERSRPFFVALLGERYGSIPDMITEDAAFMYPWLRDYRDHSLTALEIVHGVLRNPDLANRSFFYFRDPEFISHLPENKRTDFEAENPEAAHKLAALKAKIRASGRPLMENYSCRWDAVEGRLVDLDIFGQRVLEDLWTAICEEYPEEAPEADPIALERQMHESFAEERSHLHVGRIEQAKRLTEYVQGTDRRPAVITGESGCGKSAFLASWCRQYTAKNPDDFVLAYFIGASPNSTNHFRLLRTMCEELKRTFALEQELPEEDKKLSETLAVLLVAASRRKSRIVIVIDALDQLLPLEAAHGLGWLLDYIPENVRLVVSSLEGDCLDVLRRRNAEEIMILPLNREEQRQIVQTLLSEWRRKLDDRQMTALLAHPGVENPLYLRVALEELRLFGKFEELTPRIKSLAKDISGLFDQVLSRLEEDHGNELVEETFALLGCSRYGLSEAELLDLLARNGEEQFPRALWARLARGSKAYLVQRGELIWFFHRQLASAVEARYLNREKKHQKLAEYFEHASLERKLEEYPYQLQLAEEWQALAKALSDLDFFVFAFDRGRKYEWMGYWRSTKSRFELAKCYQASLKAKEKGEGETPDLARFSLYVGLFLEDMGLYLSAMPFTKHALAIYEKALGPDHPYVATSLNNLAALYRVQGAYNEALPLYKRALPIYEKALGPDHPNTKQFLANLKACEDAMR